MCVCVCVWYIGAMARLSGVGLGLARGGEGRGPNCPLSGVELTWCRNNDELFSVHGITNKYVEL